MRGTTAWSNQSNTCCAFGLLWLGSRPGQDLEAVGLQIREHDLMAGCRVRGQSEPVACAGLQIDRDVGCNWVEGTDVFQVVDVLTVTIAYRVVIFADQYLRILL